MANGKKTGGAPRPTKLTPEVHKLIVEAVAACAPRKFAAERAGVSEQVIRHWLARGRREKKGVYVSLLAAVKKAEAEAVISRVARIAKAGQGGQIVEKTTKTVTVVSRDGKQTTTTTTTEKHASPQWVADAWTLERRHPDDFALQRKRDIQDAVNTALEKALKNGQIKPSDQETGPSGNDSGSAKTLPPDAPNPRSV